MILKRRKGTPSQGASLVGHVDPSVPEALWRIMDANPLTRASRSGRDLVVFPAVSFEGVDLSAKKVKDDTALGSLFNLVKTHEVVTCQDAAMIETGWMGVVPNDGASELGEYGFVTGKPLQLHAMDEYGAIENLHVSVDWNELEAMLNTPEAEREPLARVLPALSGAGVGERGQDAQSQAQPAVQAEPEPVIVPSEPVPAQPVVQNVVQPVAQAEPEPVIAPSEPAAQPVAQAQPEPVIAQPAAQAAQPVVQAQPAAQPVVQAEPVFAQPETDGPAPDVWDEDAYDGEDDEDEAVTTGTLDPADIGDDGVVDASASVPDEDVVVDKSLTLNTHPGHFDAHYPTDIQWLKEDRPAGEWINDQLNEAARNANARIRSTIYLQLEAMRSTHRYVMMQKIDDIRGRYDMEDPESEWGQSFQTDVVETNKASQGRYAQQIREDTARLEADFKRQCDEYVERNTQSARDEWERRNGRRREEAIRNAREHLEHERDQEAARVQADWLASRAAHAQRDLDIAYEAADLAISGDYENLMTQIQQSISEQSDKLNTLADQWRSRHEQFEAMSGQVNDLQAANKQLKDDMRRQLDEQAQAHADQLQRARQDFDTNHQATLATLQEQVKDSRQRAKRLERKLEEARSDEKDALHRLETLETRKAGEYQARLDALSEDRDKWMNLSIESDRISRRSTMGVGILAAIGAVVALGVGVLVGANFTPATSALMALAW